MKDVFFKLWRYIKKYKIPIFFTIILSAIVVFFTLYIPIIVAKNIDYMLGKDRVNFNSIYELLKKIAIFTILTAFLQWIISIIYDRVVFKIARNLRNDAILKLEKVPLKYIDSNRHGEIVSKVISDVDQISDGLLMGFSQSFNGILTILLTLFFMFSVNHKMAIFVVILTPLSLFIAKFISKKTYILFKKQSEARGSQTAFLNEMLSNQKSVILFGEEENNIKKFKKLNDEFEKISLKALFFSSITNPSTRFVNNIVYAGVTLLGALNVLKGNITVGMLTCFLSYSTQYTKPFNEISSVITELQNAIACLERVLKVIDEEEEKSPIEEVGKVDGSLKIKNVNFGYSENELTIKDFDFETESGKKIAIVGPTGCGKTTLINLLMRFYDVRSGQILIGGKDINNVSRKSLRRKFGMVLQDSWIKRGTIKENIKLGKKDATDEEVIKVAKDSMCYNFIMRLPKGFDTFVSDNDGILSEGEKQLISIARVMLLNPSMLILDEATSNIDTRTESKIQEAFNKLMKNRTSFIVAHKLSTIISADVILVMKDGKIIERGKHSELINNGGFYSKLYNSQFE